MVLRVYVEKKEELANEAKALCADLKNLLGINGLTKLRILNRYDCEGIDEELFEKAITNVFSEPQLDIATKEMPNHNGIVFAVESLPGQFDMRADSAAQCIAIISCKERPIVRYAKVILLEGEISDEELENIKKYVINPVEAREASLDLPDTLSIPYEIPESVEIVDGFIDFSCEDLDAFIVTNGLAMDADDLKMCQDYFKKENRNPSITEIKMIDTYWSDHCRHTTFLTTIDSISFDDEEVLKTYNEYLKVRENLNRTKPVNLMDIGTIVAKYLKKNGYLDKLDESEEINACTVKIEVEVDGKKEPWLLLFKNETHNHPTEIEPFGGAATCIGGAIRDPLSGRAYVYAAMRLTGAGDPTVNVKDTIPGKLPQRKIVQTAASGYSSYGNQIGLTTGIVDEIYHPGYVAKHMEVGAVIGAAPIENVIRECPEKDDVVILLGGRTGRDGIGGATGSSKAHNVHSVENCGAEVQKGNAPEERKLQRLFRNPEASKMIIRCNDFGAGGVSVAVGELARGLSINLDKVPKKYEGLDGTELAISESQERMAVVVKPENVERFIKLADEENLEASIIAKVTDDEHLKMTWNGKTIVDVARDFLDSNGALKHVDVKVEKGQTIKKDTPNDFSKGMLSLLGDLNVCSKRGLSERFDSTIGTGTVLMPFGGKYQKTPIQSMVHKISVEGKHTDDCSFMSYGYNPEISSKNPYLGAYYAVIESVSKLVATGCKFEDVYLTFQEYFEKLGKDAKRWGKPVASLLGAFKAQKDLEIAAIGGKDSMSGSFEDIDVPPTLISFAVSTGKTKEVISNEFKTSGHKVIRVSPVYKNDGTIDADSLVRCFNKVYEMIQTGKAYASMCVTNGGIAEAVYKMCIGNGLSFKYDNSITLNEMFDYAYGSFLLEVDKDCAGQTVGDITDDGFLVYKDQKLSFNDLNKIYEGKLEDVYPTLEKEDNNILPTINYEAKETVSTSNKVEIPKVLIPVFPGTNCEYDSAKAFIDAGAKTKIFVINNLSPEKIENSIDRFVKEVKDSQIIFIPGGFSGGDEPDGSGKFILAFFKNEKVKEAINDFLTNRDGLMLGICNGFQALIKLGLIPFGKIVDTDENCPTLTFNSIARHQSKLVRVRVASNKSPWLSKCKVGEVYTVPVSHGEGRFLASEELVKELASKGQVATQYVDLEGNPTDDVRYNPNNSIYAIEGVTSFDGRIFGKMGHCERKDVDLYKNVEGNFDMHIFEAAVEYFTGVKK